MGERYGQLELEERCAIAAALDRAPSRISRELKRNVGSKVGYQPGYAQDQAWAWRRTGSRLARDDALRDQVMDSRPGAPRVDRVQQAPLGRALHRLTHEESVPVTPNAIRTRPMHTDINRSAYSTHVKTCHSPYQNITQQPLKGRGL